MFKPVAISCLNINNMHYTNASKPRLIGMAPSLIWALY